MEDLLSFQGIFLCFASLSSYKSSNFSAVLVYLNLKKHSQWRFLYNLIILFSELDHYNLTLTLTRQVRIIGIRVFFSLQEKKFNYYYRFTYMSMNYKYNKKAKTEGKNIVAIGSVYYSSLVIIFLSF